MRMPAESLEIRTLGQASVNACGSSIRPAGAREFALLVYLASRAGELVTRHTAADLLWDSGTLAQRLHSLSQVIYKLRGSLPPGILIAERSAVGIASDSVWLDATELRSASRAGLLQLVTELYRGDFLDLFEIRGASNFTYWADAVREELRSLTATARWALLREAEAEGDLSRMAAALQSLAAQYPDDEEIHHRRVRLLLVRGERAEARRMHCSFALRIGLSPGSPGWANHLRLLDEIEGPPPTFGPGPACATSSPSRFVGRQKEVRLLSDEFESVCSGRSGFVLVRGRAGMGKTRLCEHFLRQCALRGARILTGRCHPSEIRLALNPLIAAFASLERRDLHGLSDTVLGALQPLLAAELLGPIGKLERVPDPETGRRRLFQGLAALLIHMSQSRPVVLFLDDLHWTDDTTAAVLEWLMQQLGEARVMVVVAARREEMEANSAVGRGLARLGAWRVVEVTELEPAAVEELIQSWAEGSGRAVGQALRERIIRSAAGHPFFVLQLLANTIADDISDVSRNTRPYIRAASIIVPQTVDDFLTERFGRLTAGARAITDALSILCTATSHSVLQRVVGLPDESYVAALEELETAGVIAEMDGSVAFRHDLVREVAYRYLSVAKRRVLHGRVAKTLEGEREINPGILADHYDIAENHQAAFRFAIAAATSAERIRALPEAEHFLRIALRNAPGRGAKILVLERLGNCLYDLKRELEADPIYANAQALLGDAVQADRKVRIEVRRLAIAFGREPMSESLIARLRSVVEELRQLKDRGEAVSLVRFLIPAIWDSGLAPVVVDDVLTWLDATADIPLSIDLVDALSRFAQLAALSRSPGTALRLADKGVQLARALQDPAGIASTLEGRALVNQLAGRVDRAYADYAEAYSVVHSADVRRFRTVMYNNWAVLRCEIGDFSGAEALLREAQAYAARDSEWRGYVVAEGNLASCAFFSGDYNAAKRHAEEVLVREAFSPWYNTAISLGIQGIIAIEAGLTSDVCMIENRLKAVLADRFPAASDISIADMFIARVLELKDDRDGALTYIKRRLEQCEHGDVFCRLRLQLELARLLLAQYPQQAVALARQVRERASEMEARPLLDRAESLLRRGKAALSWPVL